MKFQKKLELAMKLDNRVCIQLMGDTVETFKYKSPEQPFPPHVDRVITDKQSYTIDENTPIAPLPSDKELHLVRDAIKTKAIEFTDHSMEVTPTIPPSIMRQSFPPSPVDTKVFINDFDGDEDTPYNNIHGLTYAFVYDVDDRTTLQKMFPFIFKEDEHNVVGWVTLIYMEPKDAATFDLKKLTIVNINELGQVIRININDIKMAAEVSGIYADDAIISKTIYFEAKTIDGNIEL